MRHTGRSVLSLALVALFALGCATEPPAYRVDPDAVGHIEQASVIGGKHVEVSQDGGWSVRTPTSGGTADSGGAVRRSGTRVLRARGGGGSRSRSATEAGPPPPAKPAGPTTGGEPADLDVEEARGSVTADPVLKDAKVAEHAGTRSEELAEELEKAEASFDAPAESKAIGVGGGAGGAFGGRRGGVARKRRPAAEPTSPGADSAAPAVQTLKAGSTDDNADYEKFLAFLAEWEAKPGMATKFQPLDVSDRRFVTVVDGSGRPVPGAFVTIVDPYRDVVLTAARTYGDGRAPYYPNLNLVGLDRAPDQLLVEVRVGDAGSWTRWNDGSTELVVEVADATPVVDPVPLDVCFLIDTTGSMSDEIASIKASLLEVTAKLRAQERPLDLRYGAVLYRDLGDKYLTARYPFDADAEAFDAALESVQAQGGGDTPESLNQGLAETVSASDWRPAAAKVVFLVADAPPHMDYEGDVWYGESLRAAVAKGIKVHSVAASGLSEVGTVIFRQIAQYTRGKFIFIQYGAQGATAAKHGVKGEVKNDNLEDILFEQILAEIETYGRSDAFVAR